MGTLWSKKEEDADDTNNRKRPRVVVSKRPYQQTVFVLKRVSSMFFDEDEDLAHEFFEECLVREGKIEYSVDTVIRWTMRRIKHNLRPQGEVDVKIPTLHVDFPVVLVDNLL